MAGCWIGFGVVCVLLLLGWVRRNREGLPFGGGERAGTALVVILGIALPIVLLTGLFFWSDIVVIRSTAAPARGSTRLTVRVIGHQWWWEVRYPGTKAVTANEIHIPAGVPVDVVTTTDDVIHSFWIPQLNRKIDLIPGRRNRVLLEAERAGRLPRASARSSAASSTRTWSRRSSPSRPPRSVHGWRTWRSPRARRRSRRSERGRNVFLEAGCAELPPAPRHAGPAVTSAPT